MSIKIKLITSLLTISLFSVIAQTSFATEDDPLLFSDQPLTERLTHPDWFTLSFLELTEDLAEANKNKRGLIIYYSQGFCPYCKAFIKNNWEKKDIVAYTQKHFNVIAIDVLGSKPLTGFDNKKYTEKSYAISQRMNFTPSLDFYDTTGKLALRLNGYRPPYQFRAALEYVSDGHHRNEKFKHYLARAESALSYGQNELNEHESFVEPPYDLSTRLGKNQSHTLVIYERKKCHSCDVLHAGPMSSPKINSLLRRFKVVQLDMQSDTIVTTLTGEKLTAKSWAEQLDFDYAPTLIFYNKKGKEIMRVDSLVGLYRLQGVLEYINSNAYLKYPTFQLWKQRFLKD